MWFSSEDLFEDLLPKIRDIVVVLYHFTMFQSSDSETALFF